MHGVGAKFVAEAFKAFNIAPYNPVPAQINPDPEFPTVAFPNPEEGKGALVPSRFIQWAQVSNCPLKPPILLVRLL